MVVREPLTWRTGEARNGLDVFGLLHWAGNGYAYRLGSFSDCGRPAHVWPSLDDSDRSHHTVPIPPSELALHCPPDPA